RLLGECAHRLVRQLPLLEENQRRYAHDVVPRWDVMVLIDIQLAELQLARKLVGQLVHDGPDLAAGAAPRGPEIDDNGETGLEHLLVEVLVLDLVHHHPCSPSCIAGCILSNRKPWW